MSVITVEPHLLLLYTDAPISNCVKTYSSFMMYFHLQQLLPLSKWAFYKLKLLKACKNCELPFTNNCQALKVILVSSAKFPIGRIQLAKAFQRKATFMAYQ